MARRIAGHADSRTTKLYERRGQKVLLEDRAALPFSEFDEENFKIALKLATGSDASLIRVASIWSGSTIVKIDGDQETLVAIIRKNQFSQQVVQQLALETGMRKMAWEIDETRYQPFLQNRLAGVAESPGRLGAGRASPRSRCNAKPRSGKSSNFCRIPDSALTNYS